MIRRHLRRFIRLTDACLGTASAQWLGGDLTMATPKMTALDQSLGEVEVPQPDPAKWAEQFAGIARQMRAVIGRHRDIVPASIGFFPGGGRALGGHERVLAIMRTGGLSDGQAVAGLYLLWVIVKGFSLEETGAEEPTRIDLGLAPAVSDYFTSLPGDRFPNLAVSGEFAGRPLTSALSC